MSLKEKTLVGIEWSAAAQISKTLLQLAIFVILARLLTPKDFGLIAMIMVFTGFVGIFSEIGFSAAIIQRLDISENHLSSVFWLNLFLGILLTIVLASLSNTISNFYNEPILAPITLLTSITFAISSLTSVHKAILQRSMDFRKLAIVETVAILVAGIFAIALALLKFGVWCLVLQSITSTTISALMIWRVSKWEPHLKFDMTAIKELFGFSRNVFGFNFFNYWSRNIDDLLIGKFISSSSLGIYTKAYEFMLMPINQISSTIGKVMFPSLSKIQNDKMRVKEIYLKTIGVIALVTFPFMCALFIVSESFVISVFGIKWIKLIPILKVFSIIGLMQSIVTTVGWIYYSQGRTGLMLRWGLISGLLIIISFLIGIYIGSIMAVVYCYAIANIILLYHNFTIPGKLINLKFFEILRNVLGVLSCAIIMALLVYVIGMIIPEGWSSELHLLVQIPFGVMVYLILIHYFKLKSYLEIKEIFWNWIKNYLEK
jgi:PST family polysaccharide transporter